MDSFFGGSSCDNVEEVHAKTVPAETAANATVKEN